MEFNFFKTWKEKMSIESLKFLINYKLLCNVRFGYVGT